jgi:hypothetical protein
MVFAQLAVDQHGQFSGHTDGVKVSTSDLFLKLWKEFSDEGIISKVSK